MDRFLPEGSVLPILELGVELGREHHTVRRLRRLWLPRCSCGWWLPCPDLSMLLANAVRAREGTW